MKILIPTIGTRGDLQPYIALGLGLKAAGHQPTISTHPEMRSLVESYGLKFAPMGPDIDIARETAAIRAGSPHWVLGFLRVMRFSFDMLEQSHPALLPLAKKTDLIIVSHSGAGSVEADQLGCPSASVTLMPQAIPAPDPNASIFQKAANGLAGAAMGTVMTRPVNQIRKRAGIKRMGPTGITSPILNLIPISPLVSPADPRWEPRHKVTGYWFAPNPDSWTPPTPLRDFLDRGPAPVVISLGAMAISGDDALQAAKISIEAVQQAGMRAVIQGWNEPMRELELPETIFHAGSVPHEWLLQRACAMVHHGGFGSTSAGLRAGIPSMAVPHIIDQFLWGQKLFELGAGPRPIPRAKLSVENLAAALVRMRDNPKMREKAADLGEAIRVERGVENAVALIEERFGPGKPRGESGD